MKNVQLEDLENMTTVPTVSTNYMISATCSSLINGMMERTLNFLLNRRNQIPHGKNLVFFLKKDEIKAFLGLGIMERQ